MMMTERFVMVPWRARDVDLAGLLEDIDGALDDLRKVLISLVLLVAAWVLFRVFLQTRAIVATAVALVTGAFVFFAVDNVEQLGEKVTEQINNWLSAPAATGPLVPGGMPQGRLTPTEADPASIETVIVHLRPVESAGSGEYSARAQGNWT